MDQYELLDIFKPTANYRHLQYGTSLHNKANLTCSYARASWLCFSKNDHNNGRNSGAHNWHKTVYGQCMRSGEEAVKHYRQITGVLIVYSTVCSGADQRKHQSPASLAIVRGIHRSPVNSLDKGQQHRKYFHLITSACCQNMVVNC